MFKLSCGNIISGSNEKSSFHATSTSYAYISDPKDILIDNSEATSK